MDSPTTAIRPTTLRQAFASEAVWQEREKLFDLATAFARQDHPEVVRLGDLDYMRNTQRSLCDAKRRHVMTLAGLSPSDLLAFGIDLRSRTGYVPAAEAVVDLGEIDDHEPAAAALAVAG